MTTSSEPARAPAAPPPARAGRRLWRLLISVAGLALLLFLLWRTGFTQLAQAFGRIGAGGFALLVLLGLVELVLDCEALRRAMRGRVSLPWTVAVQSAGGLVNTALPFEAGEVVKAALLRRRVRDDDSAVLSGLVVWNYVWKLAKPLALATCLAGGILLGNVFPAELRGPVLAGVALSFIPYLGLRVLLRQRPAERLMRLVTRHPRLERRASGWIQAATRLDASVRDFWSHHPVAYLETAGITFCTRFVAVLVLLVFARSLGLPSDAGSLLFLQATLSVADYCAMIIPARVGVSEGAAYMVFQLLGLDPGVALVIAITLRARSLLIQGPISLWAFSRPARPPDPA
jgi:hypothetical protein